MNRMLGVVTILVLGTVGVVQAQGGGGGGGGGGGRGRTGGGTGSDMGTGRGSQVADQWISSDSLITVLGITDTVIVGKIVVHVAGIDAAMQEAAEERRKNSELWGLSDRSAGPMLMRLEQLQRTIDGHLKALRDDLPKENRAAFNRIEKPDVRPSKMRE